VVHRRSHHRIEMPRPPSRWIYEQFLPHGYLGLALAILAVADWDSFHPTGQAAEHSRQCFPEFPSLGAEVGAFWGGLDGGWCEELLSLTEINPGRFRELFRQKLGGTYVDSSRLHGGTTGGV